ncbi:bifunctional riboflavin kinase/FAD synthetase [Acidicapsa ligni]|uniref:bifunctional riboflavin kinase/FAD synthetase n=1 Tax=Acidicapsa ligni TaxID=542300 RepID=UPI0021E0E9C2|nr:bifunctional riboflavin kinase/FAD synthetase [Acidicapsa ligni]
MTDFKVTDLSVTDLNNLIVFRSVAEIPAGFGPSVAVIGNFDGVHLGHQQILAAITAEARQTGAKAIAITFDPHPEQFLRPEQAPGLLTLIPERLRLLAQTGVDAVLVLPFDDSLACLSAQACVKEILVDKLGIVSIHEGANFRFGHRAEAGVAELAEFGRQFGFKVTVHAAVEIHGLEVSSSAIRQALIAGDMKRARWMLGRPFAVRSTPAKGRGIGTKLLVPTVNLAAYSGLLPAFGVYITQLTVGTRCFQAVSNIGNRPTFGEPSFAVESYILDFEPIDLSDDTPLQLEFLLRLRPEITWPSPEALKAQIMKDVSRAKRYFHLSKTQH